MSIFRPPLNETGGFYAFRQQIKNNEAVSFSWGDQQELNFIQSLNPFSYLSIYKSEERMVEGVELQHRLYQFLVDQHATTVIAHSLGCRLIFETAKQFGLPPNVRRVIWVQSVMKNHDSVKEVFPELINIWCPWDPTLLSAMFFINSSLRSGLVPIQDAKNLFLPLWRLPNLHTSSQKDSRLCDLVK